jgi:HD-GYP domain-containing protein (c-di-GMP phosphodiesterase class II)
MESSQFEPVSTLIFARLTEPLDFDVYLQLNDEKLTKIFNKSDFVDKSRLDNYVLRGISHFLILKSAREAFMNTTAKLLEQFAQSHDFVKEEALHILDETAEKVLAEIISQTKISKEHLKHSRVIIKSYAEIAGSKSSALPYILKLAKTKKKIFRHSIMTSIFATLLASSIHPEKENFTYNAGLAAFLHDLGMNLLSEDLNEHNLRLSPEMRKLIHQHPGESARILKEAALDEDVRLAILYHHENWDGTGYPVGLKKRDIPILARIVAVADQFTGLVNSSAAETPGLSPQMSFIALQKSKKLDPEILMILGQLLHLG